MSDPSTPDKGREDQPTDPDGIPIREMPKIVSDDDGVGVPNVICYNDHGNSGQIMEKRDTGGYECPECGRQAEVEIGWVGPDTDDGIRTDGGEPQEADTHRFHGWCDRCDKHPGQGGIYPLGKLDRSVCLDCLHELKEQIDSHEGQEAGDRDE